MMTREKALEHILVITAGLLLLYFVFDTEILLWISVLVGLAGLVSNYLAKVIAKGWLKLAEYLGKITSPIILSLIYFLILTPIALAYRLFNKDTMMLKRQLRNTYFIERNHTYTAEDLKDPW